MRIPYAHILGGIGVLIAAIAIGFIATNAIQRQVSVTSGVDGCVRLEGSSRQIDCLASRFEQGARDATKGTTGRDRDAQLVGYVRAVERDAGADERVAGLCHPAMHQLGRSEGARAARATRTPAFPAASRQLCTAGYVHGLAEGYLGGTPDADIAAVYPVLCHDERAKTGCAHGIGHAILRAQAGDLLTEATPVALGRCNALPGEVRPDCVNGIYMELAMRNDPKPVPVAGYVRGCASATTVEHELPCWNYLGLSITTNDIPLAEVPTWCAKGSLPGQYTCVEGYGRDLGSKRVAMCQDAGQTIGLRQRCVDGAMGLQLTSGHITKDEGLDACTTISNKRLRAHCRDAVVRYDKGRVATEAS